MIHTGSTLVGNCGMRSGVWGKPISGGMTRGAVGTEHPCMEDRIGMTAHASPRQPGKLTRRMALIAFEIEMFACQREVRLIVIEGCVLPAVRVVAAGAIGSKSPTVFIVALMAGYAIG